MISKDLFSEYVISRVTFPFTSFLMNRRRIIPTYSELVKSEWYPQEVLRDIQLAKLKQVIEHAYAWIPYYQEKFRQIGLLPGDVKRLEDVQKIPPLSRQDVIDHHHQMVDSRLRQSVVAADSSKRGPAEPIPFAVFKKHQLVRNTSSGSTGAPTIFYENGSRTALNWAHELRLKHWYGCMPGAREARMVRLSTIYLPKSMGLRLRNRLWNQLILPGVNLTDEDYAVCVEKLRSYRPKVLWGFTSAVAGLADYLRRNSIDPSPWGIQLAIGWAAPVYEHERKIIGEVFSCPVSNIYGAREVGHVAGQCPEGSFHINQEHHLVERDGAGSDGNGRETGEILVTTLDISPMPFIRYRMGDVGRTVESRCGCGRTLPVLSDFLGRTGEIYRTRDGRMISPNFWCRTFMDVRLSDAIKRFQVIYVSDTSLKIKIVKNTAYSGATEKILRDHLRKNFGQDMNFEFVYVPEIRPQLSGKYQMVVNEMGGRTAE